MNSRQLMFIAGVGFLLWGVHGMMTKVVHKNMVQRFAWEEAHPALIVGGIGLILSAIWP